MGIVNVLPELVFDLSEGQPQPLALGKTDTPVHLLPELACELVRPEQVPVLQLSLSLRPGALPAEVALDVLRLYAALNRLERSYRGAGLNPDDAAWERAAAGTTMRINLKPADPAGAGDRLAKLVRTINSTADNSADVMRYPSIERCEAQVIRTAA